MYRQDLTNCVESYVERLGWSVLPCYSSVEGKCTCGRADCETPAKHPVWKLVPQGVKDASNDFGIVQQWFNHNVNFAVACGERSGIVVLDFDILSFLDDLLSVGKGQTIPVTWTAATGRGKHFYFRYDERSAVLRSWDSRTTEFCDIKTTGGYVLLPPSRHANGKNYKWLVAPDEAELAPMPQWVIDALLFSVSCSSACPLPTTPATQPVAKPKPIPAVSTNIIAEITKPDFEFQFQERVPALERLRRWLLKRPVAISGQGGDDQTYQTALALWGFANENGLLNEDEIWQAFTEWNTRCVPPWTERRLRRNFEKAKAVVNPSANSVPETTFITTKPVEAKTTTTETTTNTLPVTNHTPAFPLSKSTADGFPVLASVDFGVFGEIVSQIEPHTEADPVAVMLAMVTMFGCAVGHKPHFVVGATPHHTNLFLNIVGDTADGKGIATGIAKAVIQGVDDFRNCITTGFSTGEGIIHALRDFGIQDSDFKTGNPETGGVDDKRLLVIESEFARPLKVMTRESNTLSSIIRQAFDEDRLGTITKSSSPPATNPHISIVGNITPKELREALKQQELYTGSQIVFSGFGQHCQNTFPMAETLTLNQYEHEWQTSLQRQDISGKCNAAKRRQRYGVWFIPHYGKQILPFAIEVLRSHFVFP